MKNDERFWWITMSRGVVALIAGSAILVIPDMAKTLLLLPLAILFSIAGLAAFGVFDSFLVFASSYVAVSRIDRVALRIQGIVGVTVGILLYSVFLDRMQLHWFFVLIVALSLITAISEFIVARHALNSAVSRWNLAAAMVAFIFGCAYFYIFFTEAANMTPGRIAWLIYSYLLLLGVAQCVTAARMIYADHRMKLTRPRRAANLEG